MDTVPMVVVDGNEAVASVAHRTNEVIAVYPITPASPMGEVSDAWSVEKRQNLWGMVPEIVEMQSEGGAAGAVHGALQAGALTTTFTASQGLLLMIPNLYKIAGELTSFCLHVAARTLATHALSIFGDHSDVMAVRQCGFALLASGSVQEAHDLACIAQAATLRARVPFLHFFDGFRTSHELSKIALLSDDDLRFMIDDDLIAEHRRRALTPDRPVLRGSAQNPDTFFQAREACNPFYNQCPGIVQEVMDRFAERTGRAYHLFDYFGDPEAERVIVLMGSGAEAAIETVECLAQRGERVGVLRVRLFRPFSIGGFVKALPPTARAIAVLDRTKEPGSVGEPLYLDVVAALREAGSDPGVAFSQDPAVIGGRYGLSSKEFNPTMVKAVLDELSRETPRQHFTVGIVDDVTGTSLSIDQDLDVEPDDVTRAVFFGFGSDGTVGANKNSVKIIGEETGQFVQGYFVYDSKKAGAATISHLRFGPRPIRSTYLIERASFVACHKFEFLKKLDVLDLAAPGATFLLNARSAPDEIWDRLPREVQQTIVDKKLRFFTIDAFGIAKTAGLKLRINTIMQTCFFALTDILPREEAIEKIKEAISNTYGRFGEEVVRRNFSAVDHALEGLHEVDVPEEVTATRARPPIVPGEAPEFVQKVTALMMANKGNLLPVSAFPADGTWPVGTTRWERRNIAHRIPIWEPDICTQCNRCALVCPHAAIRAKAYDQERLDSEPDGFRSVPYASSDLKGLQYTIQVAPEDCTGCRLCVEICPAKDKGNASRKAINMEKRRPIRKREREYYGFFLDLPEVDRAAFPKLNAKRSQFLEPLFEYSGACQGCGETAYIKLLTQLFGDRALIANATGCSSIFGGNLPTTPYTTNRDGRGPAWSNSLFEDNAEVGFGFRLAVDSHRMQATQLLRELTAEVGEALVGEILEEDDRGEARIRDLRDRVEELGRALARVDRPEARRLEQLADYLVRKSVWLVGGDGWAYDIGYGGLDHVLSQDRDVNVLVLDTEVYSNTGGQQSKATPLGAAAKFAMAGKGVPKKDLGMEAMSYGHVYVARVAIGASPNQVVNAFLEADAWNGPSLIIAYSPCVAHGYDLAKGTEQQKLAVRSGVWPLLRFDPRMVAAGEPPLRLDSPQPSVPVKDYMRNETRFRMVEKLSAERFHYLAAAAQKEATRRYAIYEQLSQVRIPSASGEEERTPSKAREEKQELAPD